MDEKAAREFSDTSREKMAGRGVAMPDGSYPIPDKDALRWAIQSFGRASDPAAVKKHIIKRAKALGATDMLPVDWKGSTKSPAKATLGEMKAEPMDTGQLDRWLMGKIPRRILMLPFGGPLKAELWGYPPDEIGRDLDGEYFDADTDIYGDLPFLRTSRERITDWHHDDQGVPGEVSRFKGAIIGRTVFDEKPESDGLWADWWAKAGERRLQLVRQLEEKGAQLFGSSQAASRTPDGRPAIRRGPNGHIEVWPVIRHTITTSPQNIYAAVPPLKALLGTDFPDDVGIAAIKAALVGLDDPGSRALRGSPKAGSGSPDGGRKDRKARKVEKALVKELTRYRRNLLTGHPFVHD